MKKTIKRHLQCDWEGLVGSVPIAEELGNVEYEVREDKKLEIIDAVIYEVDCFRNQSWWRRLLNLNPPHWIDDWLDKEPTQYFQKIIWNDFRKALLHKNRL